MSKKQEVYAPMFAHPHFKWWKPLGALALATRTGFRYFVTGREIRGEGDNASFLHDATEDFRGRPYEKLTRARWRRLARRWVLLLIPFLLASAAIFSERARWMLLAYSYVIAAFTLHYGGDIIAVWWEIRDVRRTYIDPAGAVLARVTGAKMRARDRRAAIEIPPSFGKEIEDGAEPEPVRVYVPEVVLDVAMKKRIADAVGARMGLPEPIAQWVESGVPRRYVDLYPQALPPKSITIEDFLEALLSTDVDHPIVGMMTGGRFSYMDFVNDSPHSLGSAGSGGGKSTLYRWIAMQRLRFGTYAIILDFKKWSHLRWAGRLPAGRVRIEDEVPRIHETLCRVLDELLWRKSHDLDQEDELAKLPILDVYVEEINTLMSLLVSYWTAETARQKQAARTALRRIKETAKDSEDPTFFADQIEEAEEELARAVGLPKTSPAIDALRFGVNLGREFRIHFHFIGQSMSAKAAGGRDTRESFRTRLLARWDMKTWKMLADGVPYVSDPGGDVGIWAHVHDGRADICRVPYVPDAFAVEYVLAGIRPSRPMFHGDPVPTIEEGPSVPEIAAAMALSGLVEILPTKADGDRMTLKALRIAAGRDGFPEPVGAPEPGKATLYAPDEVLAWFRDRERLPV